MFGVWTPDPVNTKTSLRGFGTIGQTMTLWFVELLPVPWRTILQEKKVPLLPRLHRAACIALQRFDNYCLVSLKAWNLISESYLWTQLGAWRAPWGLNHPDLWSFWDSSWHHLVSPLLFVVWLSLLLSQSAKEYLVRLDWSPWQGSEWKGLLYTLQYFSQPRALRCSILVCQHQKLNQGQVVFSAGLLYSRKTGWSAKQVEPLHT